jgi:tetratricopeptide (TPR) repeat protein
MVPEKPGVNAAVQRFIAISTEKAINLFEAGYTGQAIELYRDILSAYPDNDEVLLVMAKMYRNIGRIDEALSLIQNIPQQSYFYADALFTRGMMLMNRRDFTGGADCFTRLVALDTKHVEGYNNLGLCPKRHKGGYSTLYRYHRILPKPIYIWVICLHVIGGWEKRVNSSNA